MEILFKGISKRTNLPVEGSYFNASTGHTIIENGGEEQDDFHFVEKESIGQLICYDKNGNKVWSNSKIKYYDEIYSLKYSVNGWYIDDNIMTNFDQHEIEVIT